MNKKRFLAIVLELFLALIFFSCKHSVSDSVDYEKKDNLVKVSFSVEGFDSPERLITPTRLTAGSELIEKYELIGKCSDAPSGAKNTTIEKTFEQTSKSAYSQLQSYKPKLYHGKWNFTLKAYGESFSKPGELQEISESLILEFEVSSTNNKITFGMQEYNGEGKYDFTIKFPKDGAKAAKYCFSSLNGTDFSDASLETVTIEEDDDTTRSKIHLSNPVSNGLYFIRVYFYSDDAATNIISKRTIYFRVVTGLTTSQIINLDEINTPYTINYELNGGSFSPQYSMITDFNTSMNVTLPTKDNLVYSTDYTKGFFEGWYTTKEFDETSKITGWNAGDYSSDVTVYAKWTYSKVYLDPENGDDDNSGASPDKAVKSFEKAKELFQPSFQSGEDYNDYGIYVCSTIIPEADKTLSLKNYTAHNLFRYNVEGSTPFADSIIKIESGSVTLENMIIDGGASLTVNTDKTITISGFSASAPAVYVGEGTTLSMESVTIQNNVNNSSSGGGIGVVGTLNAKNSNFVGNCTCYTNGTGSKSGSGGGICLLVDDNNINLVPEVNLENCNITGNCAIIGGGVGESGNKIPVIFKMKGGTISTNIANRGGGIHLITNDGDGVLEEVIVSENYSSGNGGGIFVPALKKLYLISCTVQNNKSGGDGAGIYSTGHTRINGKTIISHNEKDDGNLSNLYITGSASDNQIIPINNNDYDISGSEIYVSVDQSKKTRTVNGYQITKGITLSDDQQIFKSDYGEDYPVRKSDDNNLYIYVDPKTFYVNSDSTGTGTALYPCKTIQSAFDIIKGFNDGSSKYTIILNSDCSPDFSKENAQNVYSNTTHYSYLNLESDKNLNLIIKSDLTQQKTIKAVSPTSEISHRAIYVGQNVNLTLENVKVTGGNCTETDESNGAVNGAGIYIENGATCVLTEGTTINENKSVENGGGIYNNGFLTLYDCNISNNTAASGNGVYNTETGSITFAVNNLPSEITISEFIYSDKNSEDSYNLFYSLDGTVVEPVETTSIYLPSLNLCLQEYKKDTIVIQNLCGVSPGSVTTENINLYNADGTKNLQYNLTMKNLGDLVLSDGAFTNASELNAYLSTLASNTSETSYPIKINVASDSDMSGVSTLIRDNYNNLYLNLDFSGSTGVTSIDQEAFTETKITEIVLPEGVSAISDYAFSFCKDLTSVTIPSSVISIGEWSFYGCKKLKLINIPENVSSIADNAFCQCEEIESIVIPKNLSTVGYSAFAACKGIKNVYITDIEAWCKIDFIDSASNPLYYAENIYLNNEKVTSIEIPAGVISIGNYAFYASSLKSVTIPSSVTSIGFYAFCKCTSLKTVIISSNVTSIEEGTFSNCSSLESVTIPSSVTSIGENAFFSCSSLESIVIPSSVTSIGDYAFSKCNNLSQITVDTNNTKYDSRDNCNAIIETSTNTLVVGCKDTIIPSSVTSIGNYAFEKCSGLTSVTIPSSVTSIGYNAFDNTGLATINYTGTEEQWKEITIVDSAIPEGVTINYNCVPPFTKATDLETYLSSLSENTAATSYPIKINVTSDEEMSDITKEIKKCDNRYLSLDFSGSTGVTKIDDEAFSGCSNLTSIKIPERVTTIGDFAFLGCSGLTSVTIPSSVISINNSAFNGCSGLTSIKIPESVTSIDVSAFTGCSGLTSVTIPSSVTLINNSAFSGCRGLTSVTIPESVTSIGISAFYGCSGLTSVTIPSSVTLINNSAFSGCERLTSVTIPSSVTSIGELAFYNTGLATINYTGTQSQWNALMANNANTGIPSGVKVIFKTTIPEGYTPMSSFDTSNPQSKYAMSSFDDLQSLQNIVNNGYGCANIEFYLCDDITIQESTPWTPIGTNVSGAPKYFYGTFDGNGHTIKFSQIYTSGNPQDGKALFGAVYNATIKNITVEGNITTAGGDASSNYAGIVGYVESNDSNKTIIENCISNVTISGSGKVENVGGIVACAKGSEINVINCINNGSLLDNNTSASKVGGIIGYSECTNCIIKNCANNGNISSKDNCAGFVGYFNGTNLTIMNCANFGILKINNNSIAGFANYTNTVTSVIVSYSYYSDQDRNIGALTSFNGTTVSYPEDPANVYGYNSDTDKTVDFINSNTNNLTINGVTYNTSNVITVLNALNAWIKWSEGGNDTTYVTYKKWKYDANGKLAFE